MIKIVFSIDQENVSASLEFQNYLGNWCLVPYILFSSHDRPVLEMPVLEMFIILIKNIVVVIKMVKY